MKDSKKAWGKYKKAKKIISLMDSRFDFDNICSNLALKFISIKLRKEHDIFYESSIPNYAIDHINSEYFEFINQDFELEKINYEDYDLLFTLDSSNPQHIKESFDFELPKNIFVINIDHHKSNSKYGDINLVEALSSTCSVLYKWLKDNNQSIDKDIAELLLTGLFFDSGFFQYDTTTSEDLRFAADFMDKGASLFDLAWKINFNQEYDDFKLTSLILNNLKVDFRKKYAYSTISDSELKKYDINIENSNLGSADIIKPLKGIDFVFVVKHIDGKKYAISFRSHAQDFSVLKIAKVLGGGGHNMAAGCVLEINSPDPVKTIVEMIEKAVSEF